MTPDMAYVFGVLGVAIVLFASGRVRLDVVALLVVFALVLGDAVTLREGLAGFSDSVILMIAGLFIVGEALVTTGIAFAVGEWLMRIGGASEERLLVLLMIVVGCIGAFMSSTGIVALFLPIVLSISAKTGFAKTRLLMPLSFAALISGMMTLIATPPNLVVNAELRHQNLEPFGFFEFTPIGAAVLLVGTAYMLLVGRRLLSASHPEDKPEDTGPTIDELVDRYGLRDKFRRLRIPAGSPLVGRTLGAAKLRTLFGVAAVGIERREGRQLSIAPALPQTEFRAGDVLYVTGHEEPAKHFVDSQGLEHLAIETAPRTDIQKELGLAEVMIPPDSELIKKTLQDAAFRSRHHVSVLAIRRGGEAKVANVTDERLKFGDTLLVSGSWKDIRLLRADKKNLIVLHLPVELADFAPARAQAPWALAILVAMIAAMTFDLMPNAIAVLMAALAMVLTRCLSMETAYKVINWPSLVLVAGMLPMATALQKTGATELIVDGLVGQVRRFRPERHDGRVVRADRHPRAVRLQHGHRRFARADRHRHRRRHGGFALSVRHDHRGGGVGRVHDAGLDTGEHPGGRSGRLHLRGLRQGRRPHDHPGDGRFLRIDPAAVPILGVRGVRMNGIDTPFPPC